MRRYLTPPHGDGPGVAFTMADLDGDGKTEIIASQFFAQQVRRVLQNSPHCSSPLKPTLYPTFLFSSSSPTKTHKGSRLMPDGPIPMFFFRLISPFSRYFSSLMLQALTVWECTNAYWSDCENGTGVNQYAHCLSRAHTRTRARTHTASTINFCSIVEAYLSPLFLILSFSLQVLGRQARIYSILQRAVGGFKLGREKRPFGHNQHC